MKDLKDMTDYEYIMMRCREYHLTGWDEEELNLCLSLLPNLSREELVQVYRNKRLTERHPLKKQAFKVLFADRIGKREERIKNMPTDELIEEFKDKKSGNVARCVNVSRRKRTGTVRRLPKLLTSQPKATSNGCCHRNAKSGTGTTITPGPKRPGGNEKSCISCTFNTRKTSLTSFNQNAK